MSKQIKTYFIGLPIFWLIILVLIFATKFYDDYLKKYVLKGSHMDIESAFAVLNEQHYFLFLILGFIGIISIIVCSVFCFKNGLNNLEEDERFFLVAIVAPLINLALLIWLLIVYSNPILIAFAIVSTSGGLFVASQS